MDLYKILGIKRNADEKEIKKAFKKKAKETHPDKGGSSEEFNEVKEAALVLLNPKKRKHYDETGNVEENEPTQHIHTHISSVFFQIISRDEHKIENVDVIAEMLNVFTKHLHEAKSANRTVQKKIDKMEKMFGRITNTEDSKENIFDGFINGSISNLKATIDENNHKIGEVNEIISILHVYECEFKVQEKSEFSDFLHARRNNNSFKGEWLFE